MAWALGMSCLVEQVCAVRIVGWAGNCFGERFGVVVKGGGGIVAVVWMAVGEREMFCA